MKLIPYHQVKRIHDIRIEAGKHGLSIIRYDVMFCLKELSNGNFEKCQVSCELLLVSLEHLKKTRPLFCAKSRQTVLDFLRQLRKVHNVVERPIEVFLKKNLTN